MDPARRADHGADAVSRAGTHRDRCRNQLWVRGFGCVSVYAGCRRQREARARAPGRACPLAGVPRSLHSGEGAPRDRPEGCARCDAWTDGGGAWAVDEEPAAAAAGTHDGDRAAWPEGVGDHAAQRRAGGGRRVLPERPRPDRRQCRSGFADDPGWDPDSGASLVRGEGAAGYNSRADSAVRYGNLRRHDAGHGGRATPARQGAGRRHQRGQGYGVERDRAWRCLAA